MKQRPLNDFLNYASKWEDLNKFQRFEILEVIHNKLDKVEFNYTQATDYLLGKYLENSIECLRIIAELGCICDKLETSYKLYLRLNNKLYRQLNK